MPVVEFNPACGNPRCSRPAAETHGGSATTPDLQGNIALDGVFSHSNLTLCQHPETEAWR